MGDRGRPAGETPASAQPAIALKHIAVGYGGEPVVRAISLVVEAREMHVLLGESGSGKTTILRAIAGFEAVSAGEIELFGDRVDHAERGRTRRLRPATPPERRGVGVVFQDYALFPHLDVAGNVAFGIRRGLARSALAGRVETLLDQVGLAGLGQRQVAELSGGQQQRVALARALAQKPRIMLLDEPFSNLNRELRMELRARTVEILRQEDITAIFVTHDRDEAFSIADRISVIHEGALLQTGTPAEIYRRPSSLAVARSVGDVNVLPAEVVEDGRAVRCGLGVVRVIASSPALQAEQAEIPGPTVAGASQILVRPNQIAVLGQPDGPDGAAVGSANSSGSGGSSAISPSLDDIDDAPGVGGQGEVERTVYFGWYDEIHLRLADGTRVVAHAAPDTVEPGQRIRVRCLGSGVHVHDDTGSSGSE